MFGENWLLERLLIWIPLVLSLTIHEWAHAACAYQLGDPTAARQGRLTLNPLEHIDPIGSFALPLLGVPFGWAKPVPIDPSRFQGSMNTGLVLTALAGPIANLFLAALAAIGLAVLSAGGWLEGPGAGLTRLFEMLILLNVILAAFNLLPFPPLDGSRVVDGIVPLTLRPYWDRLAGLGPLGIVAVIALPLLAGIDLLAWPLGLAGELVSAALGVGG